jgi:trimethyllysine dioxygenase
MKDTAYTSLALPAHTDTTYFVSHHSCIYARPKLTHMIQSDPAGLQMFHMLSHTDGSGGHSLLVDGFEALSTLRREDYKAFEILCQVAIPAHASGNEGITITPYKHFPMFSYKSPDLMETEFPDMVRWNNDDRGVVPLKSYTVDGNVSADEWYAAASKWNEIIKRKEMEYWVKLEPGRALSK